MQPLDRSGQNQERRHSSGGTPTFGRNTVGAKNNISPAAFTMWQPQFDRDFASIGELLSIPLYGPRNATQNLRLNSLNPRLQAGHTLGPAIAAARFLQPRVPGAFGADGAAGLINTDDDNNGVVDDELGERGMGDDPDPISSPEFSRKFDNRWYRLLEFVVVPTRTHRQLTQLDPQVNSALDVPLVSGQVNLGMLRHPEVFAALLDDPQVAGDGNAYMLSTAYMNNPNISGSHIHMPDRLEGNTRDWWEQFLFARDRQDPITGLYLPGLAGSRPFRSFAFLGRGNDSIDDTLLRGLKPDTLDFNGADQRRLLELGTPNDFVNKGNAQNRYRNPVARDRPVDPLIRHRLLSKIIGNTTTRSHSFVVFISVAFFEAKMINGGLRIGGRLGGKPSDSVDHRGVFVVNRALIDKAYNPTTGLVDWEKLVEYRLTVK